MEYRARKCPHMLPPTNFNYWDLLLNNPAGKPDVCKCTTLGRPSAQEGGWAGARLACSFTR